MYQYIDNGTASYVHTREDNLEERNVNKNIRPATLTSPTLKSKHFAN